MAATSIAHAEGFHPQPGPVVVYLNRHGGTLTAGPDDPAGNRSELLDGRAASIDVPAFAGTDWQWAQLTRCIEDHYEPFAVRVVQTRPEGEDYVMAMVGGTPDLLGMEDTVRGLAPYNGQVIRSGVIYTFQTDATTDQTLCEVTAHEIGHMLGLDHTRSCGDLMSYESCGPKRFDPGPAACGEWEDRVCAHDEHTQSSWHRLASNVGLRDGSHDDGPLVPRPTIIAAASPGTDPVGGPTSTSKPYTCDGGPSRRP